MHAPSPFGAGDDAKVAIEHHKFLVRDRASRAAIAQTYEAYHRGYGSGGMLPFSLPEDAYAPEEFRLVPYCCGDAAHIEQASCDMVTPT